eukprot:scaffold37850_cov29-Prasinocladus_malaysianus.AAC.1
MLFQTGNPALTFGNFQDAGYPSAPSRRGADSEMTINGAVDRTALLLLMATGAAAMAWSQIYAGAMTAPAVMAMTQCRHPRRTFPPPCRQLISDPPTRPLIILFAPLCKHKGMRKISASVGKFPLPVPFTAFVNLLLALIMNA